MNRAKKPLYKFLGVILVATGLIGAQYFWEPHIVIPNIKPYLPSIKFILYAAGFLCVLIYLYYYKWRIYRRVREAFLYLFFQSIFALILYVAIVSLANYHKFKSFNVAWQILFKPEQLGFSHVIGGILFIMLFVLSAWDGVKKILGVGEGESLSTGVFHQRGRRLISYDQALQNAERLLGENEPWLWWGMMRLPLSVATSHFAICNIREYRKRKDYFH
jgi:hypothetical protein